MLARIDDRDLATALQQAEADVASAEAAITTLDAEIQLQHTLVDQAEAAVAADQATLHYAEQDDARYSTLSSKGYGSVQQAQQANATLRERQAAAAARPGGAAGGGEADGGPGWPPRRCRGHARA